VRLPRRWGAATADKEIEVAAPIGLLHVLDEQAGITARGDRRRRSAPGGAAMREFSVTHIQMQASRLDVQLDLVALPFLRAMVVASVQQVMMGFLYDYEYQ